MSKKDLIRNPDHYSRGGLKAKKVVKAMINGESHYPDRKANCLRPIPFVVFGWWFNALKYLWRWTRKNGIQDLRKARECIKEMIDELEASESDHDVILLVEEAA